MLSKLVSGLVGQLKPDRILAPSPTRLVLPPPELDGGEPLMRTLSRRRSERSFRKTPLPLQIVANVLWAAFGMNRPDTGDRTAPSALNAQDIDIYAALSDGLYLYAAKSHTLHLVSEADARRVTGYQDFVDDAPLDLIYVWDRARTPLAAGGQQATYAAICAGAITQNVYLYCASAGLATVARAFFDQKALAAALSLGLGESVAHADCRLSGSIEAGRSRSPCARGL